MLFSNACVQEGKYLWTESLRRLHEASQRDSYRQLKEAGALTPLQEKSAVWASHLCGHPDRWFSWYIRQGLENGFRLGVREGVQLVPARKNLQSALYHEAVVQEYLDNECKLGRVVGPLMDHEVKDIPIQLSPLGAIPKKRAGQWRLMVDLSSPWQQSVNDGIDTDAASLEYVTLDVVAEAILAIGKGAMLGKCDVKSAYWLVPVHPGDWTLLGIKWRGSVYLDTVLPFGLRSAPKIFMAVADAFHWIVHQEGVNRIFHYVDDFIIIGRNWDECSEALRKVDETAKLLGMQIEPSKWEGPTSNLIFLGIELDVANLVLRLPEEKLQELSELVAQWVGKKCGTKKELESLAGKLQHACKVVRPGRCFLRRVYALIAVADHKRAMLRLNRELRADIGWWHMFMAQWNGVSILWRCQRFQPDEEVWSDASGGWGCGAHWKQRWFQCKWVHSLNEGLSDPASEDSIAWREMVPIVVAGAGRQDNTLSL